MYYLPRASARTHVNPAASRLSRLFHSESAPSRAMAVIHIVLFKFRPDVSQQHKDNFVAELRKLKSLPCVQDAQLTVGGPSITDPMERSKGFQFALVSRHKDRAALEEYQASKEHHDVVSKLLWPFMEDVCRFDFETADDKSSNSLI